MNSICVFCGSSPGNDPAFTQAAQRLGQEISRRGLRLIYGGGRVGLMGVVADAALAEGGHVHGIIPRALFEKEVGHDGLTELTVVETMHKRKAAMADAADAFIALPGGFGTFEEFCEVLTWTQLGVHNKPCGLLNVADFYRPLLDLFDRAEAARFLRQEHRAIVLDDTAPGPLLDRLVDSQPVVTDKWIDRG